MVRPRGLRRRSSATSTGADRSRHSARLRLPPKASTRWTQRYAEATVYFFLLLIRVLDCSFPYFVSSVVPFSPLDLAQPPLRDEFAHGDRCQPVVDADAQDVHSIVLRLLRDVILPGAGFGRQRPHRAARHHA